MELDFDFRKILGPWQGEPDREEFRHAGLPCIVNRNDLGAWCGYAGVPFGHPLHGVDPDNTGTIDVHGGITYARPCQGKICHVPAAGETDDVWWFGFDCAHCFDIAPGLLGLLPEGAVALPGRQYRDLAFVKAETCRLAEQLAEVKA